MLPPDAAGAGGARQWQEEGEQPPLPGLAAWCRLMAQETGVQQITMGRQAMEQRVVSQDLEIWMSAASRQEGSYSLVARAGRQACSRCPPPAPCLPSPVGAPRSEHAVAALRGVAKAAVRVPGRATNRGEGVTYGDIVAGAAGGRCKRWSCSRQ